jgi:hypothetical protein
MSEEIVRLLPFLIPVIVIQVGLTIASLIHVLMHKTYRKGNRVLWIIISFISIIGPIIYFTIGRGDD